MVSFPAHVLAYSYNVTQVITQSMPQMGDSVGIGEIIIIDS